jgi:hypothetical protein
MGVFAAEVNRYDKPGATFETTQYDLQSCNVYGPTGRFDGKRGQEGIQACMAAAGYTRKGSEKESEKATK